jgi:alpha-1,3-rhamnosyl/mannosyltransferase
VRRLGLPATYLLYVGTIEPRKNLLMLLEAYCSLSDSTRRRCPLVLAGNWGWSSDGIAQYYHDRARHLGVIHQGYLADEHLPAVYNGARALVYPSLYEGFGLPPMEMMATGGAVLASTAGALVETVGNKACLLDARDTEAWRRAMERAILDEEWLFSLRNDAQELARPFTWDRAARETLNIYRRHCPSKAEPWPRAA